MSETIDPYQILEIGPGAPPREILAAVGRAMRTRRHPIQQVAAAQRELLDPLKRAVHDFVQRIDLEPLLAALPQGPARAERPAPPALVTLDPEPGDHG